LEYYSVSTDSYRGFEESGIFLFHRKTVQEANTQIAGTKILRNIDTNLTVNTVLISRKLESSIALFLF
jgi:hypothetical protein